VQGPNEAEILNSHHQGTKLVFVEAVKNVKISYNIYSCLIVCVNKESLLQ
jgi:hypothetical protein